MTIEQTVYSVIQRPCGHAIHWYGDEPGRAAYVALIGNWCPSCEPADDDGHYRAGYSVAAGQPD